MNFVSALCVIWVTVMLLCAFSFAYDYARGERGKRPRARTPGWAQCLLLLAYAVITCRAVWYLAHTFSTL